jgi:hypothetical protein
MRFPRSSFAVCAAMLVLAGCPKPSEPSAADASAEAPTPPPEASSTPGPTAAFTLQYTLADAGVESIPIASEEEGRPLIEPTSALELRSTLALRNYRIRLFDEVERAMVSDDTAEESAAGLRYRISLPTPLKAGFKYTLVVDAQTGTSILDAQGRELADLRIPFQVAGEKEKEPPPTPKKRRR